MAKSLPIQKLEFDELKQQLVEYLKGQDKFRDYNFRGSGFDVIMDLLAYNAHYMGFYANMLANESFIDSAYLRSSLTSKAKLLNYIPKNSMAATAEVIIKVDVAGNPPSDGKVLFKRGDFALSLKDVNNNHTDGRNFVLIDDVYVYNKASISGQDQYESDVVEIYEGTFVVERSKVDTSQLNQRFILKSKTVDYRTIKVKVYPSENEIGSDNFTAYHLADDFMVIDGKSPVFFLSTDEDEHYEVVFGKKYGGTEPLYGLPVEHGNIIEISYVESNGELGNDAKEFLYNGDVTYDVTLDTVSISDGGRGEESLDELKFNIPHHYKRQNRLVTPDDYKNILLTEYPNISSINVWGGEDHYPKTYGRVFICIKPKFGDILSSYAKNQIKTRILGKYMIATVEPELVDADFLYVNLDLEASFNPTFTDRTSGEIKSIIQSVIKEYNDMKVSKFDGYFSEARLSSRILDIDSSIVSVFFNITLEKKQFISIDTDHTYTIDYTNQIVSGTVKSDEFQFRGKRTYFVDDENGKILAYQYNDTKKEYELIEGDFGDVDYELGIVRLNKIKIDDTYTKDRTLSFKCSPVHPDFYPVRNNILKIQKVTISVTEDYLSNV